MKCSSQATLKLEYLFQEKDNQCSKPIRIGLENILEIIKKKKKVTNLFYSFLYFS